MRSPPGSPVDPAPISPGSAFSRPARRFPPDRPPRAHDTSPQGQRPPQPPRLPSPRLFRDFFDAMSDTVSRRQATLPRANYRDSAQDFNRALHSTNRALQTVEEAFQARTTGSHAETAAEITSSPPENPAEAQFFSQTTHPHDSSPNQRSRRSDTLGEPVYGSRPHPLTRNPVALVRFWPFHTQDEVYHLPFVLPEQHPSQSFMDDQAINRQRENHSNWERAQARNRTRGPNPPRTMPPPPPSSSSSTSSSPSVKDAVIESVDLTGVDDNATLSAVLAKQRQDAILAQNQGTESGRTSLTAYKCPVCMETPTDATSTICGHVFCHRCIIDTLNWSIDQRRLGAPRNRKVKGVCPVCRKQLDLKDAPGKARSLVPLELKFMVRKRKRDDKGKQKLVKAETLSDDEDPENRTENEKENIRAGKARKRDTTEEALWEAFMVEG